MLEQGREPQQIAFDLVEDKRIGISRGFVIETFRLFTAVAHGLDRVDHFGNQSALPAAIVNAPPNIKPLITRTSNNMSRAKAKAYAFTVYAVSAPLTEQIAISPERSAKHHMPGNYPLKDPFLKLIEQARIVVALADAACDFTPDEIRGVAHLSRIVHIADIAGAKHSRADDAEHAVERGIVVQRLIGRSGKRLPDKVPDHSPNPPRHTKMPHRRADDGAFLTPSMADDSAQNGT